MTALARTLRRLRPGSRVAEPLTPDEPTVAPALAEGEVPPFDIAPDDPALAYFGSVTGVVDVDELELDSPAVRDMRAAGVKLVVPLVAQGELIGLLNLGPRLSEQDYSADDRKLLDQLAAQAAPAVRVAQVVREHEAEVAARERVQQELQVAQLIQQNFLPKELPELAGWQVAAYYRPAREVGGDFYDFIELDDGKIGVVVGDVTDKGVPAALVMAATRSVLRASAQRLTSPSEVLRRVNEHLVPDIPPKMFVTCLYGVLDPETGEFHFANAGHNLPYVGNDEGVTELWASGMPLGLMSGMTYEETRARLEPGDSVLLHSDGLAEAHDTERRMFGFPRLMGLVGKGPSGQALIDEVLSDLWRFTGPAWEQEDDITLVTLHRPASPSAMGPEANGRSAHRAERASRPAPAAGSDGTSGGGPARDSARGVLATFDVPSAPGNERLAIDRVKEVVAPLGLAPAQLERLGTAVGEATMNAMEHGNAYREDAPVSIRLTRTDATLFVEITDHGGGREIPAAVAPDLDAKLAGLQTPRGWGLFLIENMVDEVAVHTDETHHTVELSVHLNEEGS